MRGVAQPRPKFLDQPRLADTRFANNQHQLPVTLPRPLPAPHQHGDLLVTTDQRRETALPRAASDTARPYQAEQGHRLRYASEFVTAALLDNKQTGDLPLHARRDHDLARLGHRLRAGRDVGHVAEKLVSFDQHRPPLDRNARGKRGLARAGVLAVQFGQRALDREGGPRSALGVVLQRDRIAEQHHQPVALLSDDLSAHFRHCRRSPVDVGAKQVAPLLRVELRGNTGRIHEIAEHHRYMTAIAGGFGCGRCRWLWEREHARVRWVDL